LISHRVLRLTLLAPEIVEAILDGRQDKAVSLEALRERFPVEWNRQLGLFAGASRRAAPVSAGNAERKVTSGRNLPSFPAKSPICSLDVLMQPCQKDSQNRRGGQQ